MHLVQEHFRPIHSALHQRRQETKTNEQVTSRMICVYIERLHNDWEDTELQWTQMRHLWWR